MRVSSSLPSSIASPSSSSLTCAVRSFYFNGSTCVTNERVDMCASFFLHSWVQCVSLFVIVHNSYERNSEYQVPSHIYIYMNVVPLRACVQLNKFCSYTHFDSFSPCFCVFIRLFYGWNLSLATFVWNASLVSNAIHKCWAIRRLRDFLFPPTCWVQFSSSFFFILRFRCNIGNGMTDAQFYR